jgi:Tfp pilus assembly protein PilZ
MVDVMEVQSSAVFSSEVLLYDISINGVSLITDRKLGIGKEYALRIMDKDLDIPLQGKVVWVSENTAAQCREEYAHLTYAAGLNFTGLPQETITSLKKFVESQMIGQHTQVKVPEKSDFRCNIRSLVSRGEKAMLNVEETYRVKKLSLGGLQLESDHDFEPETRLHMSITIPGEMHLTFIGRVASCIPSPCNPSHVDVGIQFIDMPEEEKMKLKEFIRRLYLEDAGF